MLAVTFYCIPALFMNGGPSLWILYVCIACMNTILRLTEATSFFTACALVLFVMVKYKISSGTKSLPSIQAEAIAAAIDNDAADDTAFKERKNDVCSDVNPIQKLFRRHSSITMKHCPYTNGTHVVYECPSCFAKVSDSAWHQSHACARTGGGAFFTLRDRLATLMDITEDIDEYFESKDVDASKSIKQRILDALGGLQFKKNNFNDDNVSTIKSYVYWQVQRALLCKANYLFRAVSESCMPCYCYILCTEVINRAVLSFGSMGILVSIFLLRASDEVRAMRPLLFVNGILSPCLALNALMTAALCLYELYGLGVHFPDLFYDKRFARAIERAKFLFQFLGFKEHFATRK